MVSYRDNVAITSTKAPMSLKQQAASQKHARHSNAHLVCTHVQQACNAHTHTRTRTHTHIPRNGAYMYAFTTDGAHTCPHIVLLM